MSFNPLAVPGAADFGLLYVGVADGGSGGDPLGVGQNLGVPYGKILRIDPLGSNSANGRYGIPTGNPFAIDGDDATLGEIYAYGVRNPQRFGWDSQNGNMFLADIGQNIVEELSLVASGANLGWNAWEGSFGYVDRSGVRLTNQRGDAGMTYPVVEYGQADPLLGSDSAITGVHVYRSDAIPQLEDLVLFGDFPSGEIFYILADALPNGGQDAIRRILLNDGGEPKTLLESIQEKNVEQGRSPASRADLRFASGPEGQVFLLNKHDGTIRLFVPDADASR
jgi:glucose/arabinose dehydrogenase